MRQDGLETYFQSLLKNCIKTMEALSNNIEVQYEGKAANRGLRNPGGAIAGSFGNPDIL